jgi:hypothetical protein
MRGIFNNNIMEIHDNSKRKIFEKNNIAKQFDKLPATEHGLEENSTGGVGDRGAAKYVALPSGKIFGPRSERPAIEPRNRHRSSFTGRLANHQISRSSTGPRQVDRNGV